MIQPKIRNKLCEDCKKIIRDSEEEYREEHKEEIKARKHIHYLKQKSEGKVKTGKRALFALSEKEKEIIRKELDKIPLEECI